MLRRKLTKDRLSIFFFIVLSPFFLLSQSEAETRYVSDYLTINLKDNLEKPYQVVAKVKSNEPLTILEENETYAKVETGGKQVGWIAKQYLTTALPKSLVVDQLRKEIADLRANRPSPPSPETAEKASGLDNQRLLVERDHLQAELQTAMSRITEFENAMAKSTGQSAPPDAAAIDSEIKQLVEKKQQLETEITALQVQYESLNDGTVDVSALMKEKEDFLDQIKEKDARIASLSAENEKLARTAMIYWFCAGALVFVIGMFSGKMFSRKKTKYSY